MNCQDGCTAKQVANGQIRQRSLRPNPFTTYRDPKTGQWMIVLHASQERGMRQTSVEAFLLTTAKDLRD